MEKKITIARGLVSLINNNVKAKCPEWRITLDLQTMKIDSRPAWKHFERNYGDTENELVLFDENGGGIGYNTVTRASLIEAAKRALAKKGMEA